ncbi:MAG: PD40 domain-containing protein, partial [bacterium]|nr:PD40 domain-containing protein [Candidatus Kapabacteria bacterium]
LGTRDTEAGTIAFAPSGSPFATVAYISECFVEGSIGGCDLYAVTAGDRPSIINLGRDVNSELWESQPYVTADGNRLFFASERNGGFGKSDIWYSERQSSGAWGAAHNAGPIVNTSEDELSPFMDPATNRLYFASVIPGRGREIFVLEEGAGQRFILPAPFNSESDDFTPFLAGGRMYLASNRAGGCGGYDVYGFPAPVH